MRKIYAFIIILLIGILPINASDNPKHRLKAIFEQAERWYLTDDFEQLRNCINEYDSIFNRYKLLFGDTVDVYYAYYYKMRGAYYYGLVDGDGYYFRQSKASYQRSLEIFTKRNNDKNVNTLREELAQLYYKVKKYKDALAHLDTIYAYYDYRLNDLEITSYEPDYYRTLSQMAICNARLGQFEQALQQITEAQKYFKKEKNEFYYEALRRQGKILMLQADSLGSTHYKDARRCYEKYVAEEFNSIAQRLDTMTAGHRSQHWLATHKFLYDCYRLGNHAPELLYDLALFSKGYLIAYENDAHTNLVKWEQVRKKLTPNDCAIEFVQYFGKCDEKRMGCLVLKSNAKPLFIDLFATDSLLSLELTTPFTVGDAFDAFIPEIKDTLYRDTRLQNLIWSPKLMSAIGKAKRVYFAPDGLIHQWAIEYLIPDSQKTCYRLSSTRNLTLQHPNLKLQSAIFCGGISYNAYYLPTQKDNDYMAYRYLKPRIKEVKNLPYTRIEVDSIYACRHNPKDTLLKGAYATDSRIVTLLKQNHYDIIHISTHGHYIGRIEVHNDLRPLAEDLSLSRCGLIFAGAANTLTDNNFDDSRYDAIISGTEIAGQDLSKTELVVLNACRTGIGRLTDDGIYGLQRAIKQAGAGAMIVSLWDLYDYSSAIFLRFFYEEIEKQKSKKDIHTAFLAARKRLMEHEAKALVLDETTLNIKLLKLNYRAPRHINPFIMVDVF